MIPNNNLPSYHGGATQAGAQWILHFADSSILAIRPQPSQPVLILCTLPVLYSDVKMRFWICKNTVLDSYFYTVVIIYNEASGRQVAPIKPLKKPIKSLAEGRPRKNRLLTTNTARLWNIKYCLSLSNRSFTITMMMTRRKFFFFQSWCFCTIVDTK